jgi:hypothetical protein
MSRGSCGLWPGWGLARALSSRSCSFYGVDTYGQCVNHSLEAHVDLAAADDLGHIGGVIGLQESDFEALVLEVAAGLGEVQRSVVRGGVP